MAAHQEPPGGEHGRAVADRVPIFSLFGAEVISSVGTTSPCWRCLVRLVTTGSPVRTLLTGAAMGSGRPWRRCSAGRSWIGWASQRAAPDRGDHRHQRDDSTTFGAVLKDVPPIRTPSTTLARRGTRGSRRSRRMVVTQFGHDAGQVAEQFRRPRPPALSPGAFGRLPQVATWRTRTRAEPMACRWQWPVLAGDHNPCLARWERGPSRMG
jgi:hypothetical protein